jgi:hypothetical protein
MTNSTTPPLLTPLPPAPLPTDAEAVFDAKAGASLTAQAVMVGEVNTALAWQADSMAASLGYKDSAVASALAAAESASASANSASSTVSAVASQVAAAALQANAAAASAANAQLYAASAGAAAGLPAVAGNAGKAMVAKLDESGFELKNIGQAIGDILVTSRAPLPAENYLLTNRAVYLQSSYPQLYGGIGAITDLDRAIPLTTVFPSSFSSGVKSFANSGSAIVLAQSGPPYARVARSTDNGVSWGLVTLPVAMNYTGLSYGGGLFVMTGWDTAGQPSTTYLTSPDGVIWTQRNLPIAAIFSVNVFFNGLFILARAGGSYLTSIDGLTWVQRDTYPTFGFDRFYVANGRLFVFGSGSWYSSTVDGLNWVSYPAPMSINCLAFIGGRFFVWDGSGVVYMADSYNGPWVKYADIDSYVGYVTSPTVFLVGEDCVVFGDANARGVVSYDSGKTWRQKVLPIGAIAGIALPEKFLLWAGTSYSNWPLRSYDRETQFITPELPAQPVPYKTYIKAKSV